MHHLLLVRESQGIRDPRHQIQYLARLQQIAVRRVIAQVAPLEVFHCNIRKAALFSHIIDGHDVRMVEPPGGFGLAEEPRPGFIEFAFDEFAGQRNRLDRDQAVDGGVAAEVHDAHGAAAVLAFELISSEARNRRHAAGACLAGRRRGGSGCGLGDGGGGPGRPRGPVGIHQPAQARGDVAVAVVEPCQVPVHGRCLRCAPALFQLGGEAVQIAHHGGVRPAALEFCKVLFEVVQQTGGLEAGFGLGSRHGRRQRRLDLQQGPYG